MSFHRVLAAVASSLVLFSVAVPAQTVTGYRFSPDTISGDDVFTYEVSVDDHGHMFRVTRDATGRLTKAEVRHGGKTTRTLIYKYAPDSPLPSGYDDYSADMELSGRESLTRDASGFQIRQEDQTPGGAVTGYLTRVLKGNDVEVYEFTRDGKQSGHSIGNFAASGYLVRRVVYFNDSTSYDRVVEEATGLSLSRHKVQSNKIVMTTKYLYEGGELTSENFYDTKDAWYGGRDYSEGRARVERYKLGDHTQESHFTYDAKNWLSAATFVRDNVVICTFKYERLADGTIARTLATGSNGELFAEYPDLTVSSIERNGRPLDHPDAGKIYKTGLWW